MSTGFVAGSRFLHHLESKDSGVISQTSSGGREAPGNSTLIAHVHVEPLLTLAAAEYVGARCPHRRLKPSWRRRDEHLAGVEQAGGVERVLDGAVHAKADHAEFSLKPGRFE